MFFNSRICDVHEPFTGVGCGPIRVNFGREASNREKKRAEIDQEEANASPLCSRRCPPPSLPSAAITILPSLFLAVSTTSDLPPSPWSAFNDYCSRHHRHHTSSANLRHCCSRPPSYCLLLLLLSIVSAKMTNTMKNNQGTKRKRIEDPPSLTEAEKKVVMMMYLKDDNNNP